jgi:hypothetical protein
VRNLILTIDHLARQALFEDAAAQARPEGDAGSMET